MPKRIKFTKERVEKVVPIEGKTFEVYDTEEKGLFLRVAPTGRKTWGLRYRTVTGVHRRLKLGRADTVLPEPARQLAKEALAAVGRDADPAGERKITRANLRHSVEYETIEKLAERYFTAAAEGRHKTSGKPKRTSTLALERDHFDRYIKPTLGDLRIQDLTRRIAQRLVDDVSTGAEDIDKPSASAGRMCKVVLSAICSFAIRQDIIGENPVQGVGAPKFEARETVLSDIQIQKLWSILEGASSNAKLHVSRSVIIALELALMILQRRGEISGMRFDELDLDRGIWTIPGSRTKNGRTHAVPLPINAVELIREAIGISDGSAFVFASPRGEGADRPIDPPALSHAFRRVCAAGKIRNVRLHDLRRTGASNLTSERIGVPRFFVSQLLNHTSDTGGAASVTSTYDRYGYWPEKKKALGAWADLLANIVGGAERTGEGAQT